MKFNYYHAPVGSVIEYRVSKVIDAPTTVCSVTDIIRNSYASYIVVTDIYNDITDCYESINVAHITQILHRGNGGTELSGLSYGTKFDLLSKGGQFILDTEISKHYSHKKNEAVSFSKSKLLMYLINSDLVKEQHFVDFDKMADLLIDQGFIKIIDLKNKEYFDHFFLCNKKKIKAAIKRVYNKCLRKHKEVEKQHWNSLDVEGDYDDSYVDAESHIDDF